MGIDLCEGISHGEVMDLPRNNLDGRELAGMKDDDPQFGCGMQVARFVFADPTRDSSNKK